MKLYFAIIFIAINSALGFGQVAEFSFLGKTTAKWDKVNEGKQLQHYFVFENSGTVPLIIQDAKVACSCTKVEFTKAPIAPGQKDSIRVTFDTNEKYYYQDRTIELVANTKKTEKLRLKVYVIPKDQD
jgi:hypothetical protein